jgi:ankyrin repeat protein
MEICELAFISGHYLSASECRCDMEQNGVTALVSAAWKGRIEVVTLLMAAGADIQVQDKVSAKGFHSAKSQGILV